MIQIPCETVVRLSALIKSDVAPEFRVMRFENGKVIVTNRRFGVVEQNNRFEGTFHVLLPDALIEQCRVEKSFSSVLTITPNPILKYTTAITTMGFQVSENIGYWEETPLLDTWHDKIVKPCLTPATASRGAFMCHSSELAILAETSPSGDIIFEANIDTTRVTVVRDLNSSEWAGFFIPRLDDGMYHAPAAVPSWLKGE